MFLVDCVRVCCGSSGGERTVVQEQAPITSSNCVQCEGRPPNTPDWARELLLRQFHRSGSAALPTFHLRVGCCDSPTADILSVIYDVVDRACAGHVR